MNKNELTNILELHKKWIKGDTDGKRADLRGANLSDADLRRANLSDADLRYANLRYANLRGANLRGANLSDADLSDTNLRGADLSDADLSDADLSDADLRRANLSDADLSDADLDYSCLPLWCGSLTARMDDKQVIQLLYHIVSIVQNSDNVSEKIKTTLLTDDILEITNSFHRVDECGELKGVKEHGKN